MARAGELARLLASHAPLTLRVTKEGLRRLRNDGPGAPDHDLVETAYMSDDFKEGMEAFLAKRPPQWKGH
jgi:enoyl-CoA hydratase/carnithine racemase